MIKGTLDIAQYRNGKLVQSYCVNNAVTIEGRVALLNRTFNNIPIIPKWYLGLVNQNDFIAFDDNDTLASHPGWRESDAYTVRPEWLHNSQSAFSAIDTPIKNIITSEVETVIRGAFLASSTDTSGILWATVGFPNMVLYKNDRLVIGYRVYTNNIPYDGIYHYDKVAINFLVIDQGPY